MYQIKLIHMVGIGGAGMNGIARILLNLGFEVSGSDRQNSQTVKSLIELGASIEIGHGALNLSKNSQTADVVVISSAIGEENPEVVEARRLGLPVIPRAEMLAELMRFRYGIAVAGTHGKTTTTSLITALLTEAGLDPTYVIGGRISRSSEEDGDDGGAQLGSGKYLVAEADESDASFLHLQPMVAVVTNIDEDHMSTYGGDIAKLDDTFREFIHHLPFYGRAVICADDPGVERIADTLERPLLRYGVLSEDLDFRADDITPTAGGVNFKLIRPDREPLQLKMNLPGRHNVMNALAAIAVASHLDIEDEVLVSGLANFIGIERRFQNYGELEFPNGMVQLVDDYGHHPQEVAATIVAMRESWPERRLVLAFQPHRYSRTRDLYEDFVEILSSVDLLLLLEVFPAGESHILGADGHSLIRTIRARGEVEPLFIKDPDELVNLAPTLLEGGDMLLISGAGSIGAAAAKLADR
ncbi:MAG: UDP-N-acetylmuramate--L-alanine ligase [Thiotrichales bacterium]|jgi:UDP-N-acetylmuramate--alanine ligase|nr:UDP-N-acetylmuramate--L-alanine ligase [Thiotrichales bacterium]MBT3613664.1 UDP-N-acetylmuramate--L-alanine ligase [Thiotrichales bacterium]MBT3753179.1 UDP-N-acetylmuramate--L-alanine ligase [Thiotrichales bacterium]MBT3837751.1 UDP-N-acetylmuramate--L-alanine ligase [Thiotrichales bacterium]MBT4152437.1 UDP-N-acetylmuramate--L-alanine ligase [Thiotrichales bacterium]